MKHFKHSDDIYILHSRNRQVKIVCENEPIYGDSSDDDSTLILTKRVSLGDVAEQMDMRVEDVIYFINERRLSEMTGLEFYCDGELL